MAKKREKVRRTSQSLGGERAEYERLQKECQRLQVLFSHLSTFYLKILTSDGKLFAARDGRALPGFQRERGDGGGEPVAAAAAGDGRRAGQHRQLRAQATPLF